MSKYLSLNDIHSYKIAFHLSNKVWNEVLQWDYLAKDTVGKQLVRSVDSISANIAEGFGRYSKKDRIKFYRYSLGSTWESLDWVEKAKIRNLLSYEIYDLFHTSLKSLPKEINHLIRFTNQKLTI